MEERELDIGRVMAVMERLAMLAGQGLGTSADDERQMVMAAEDRAQLQGGKQVEIQMEEILKKWRHYNPRKGRPMLDTTQRQLEAELRTRWLTRLIGHLEPHAKQIPNMKQLRRMDDPLKEYMDLFGFT